MTKEEIIQKGEKKFPPDEKLIIPNDRDEAAKEYAKTTFKKPYSDNPNEEVTIVEPDKYAGFIAGAKWQYQKDRGKFAQIKAKTWSEGFDACKEQMMSEAVHGWLDEDNEPPYDLNVCCEEKIPFGKFKHGDKVRIVILPKEELK